MKATRCWGFGPRKSKSGFTLIELLIVMVILAILAGVVVMAVGGVFGTARKSAYNSVRDDVQNAVGAYSSEHQGSFGLPLINTSNTAGEYYLTTTNNCTAANPCYALNMSALMQGQVGGSLRKVPDGCRLANCMGSSALGCTDNNHYVWYIHTDGNVFTTCITPAGGTACAVQAGTGALLANDSGYAGAWP